MTKEQKASRIAEIKAEAFDEIEDVRLIVDSHRNFHRMVSNIIREARHSIAEVNRLAEDQPAQLIRCEVAGCPRTADSQVNSDGESHFYCDEHTTKALAEGQAKLVVAEDLAASPLSDSLNESHAG